MKAYKKKTVTTFLCTLIDIETKEELLAHNISSGASAFYKAEVDINEPIKDFLERESCFNPETDMIVLSSHKLINNLVGITLHESNIIEIKNYGNNKLIMPRSLKIGAELYGFEE